MISVAFCWTPGGRSEHRGCYQLLISCSGRYQLLTAERMPMKLTGRWKNTGGRSDAHSAFTGQFQFAEPEKFSTVCSLNAAFRRLFSVAFGDWFSSEFRGEFDDEFDQRSVLVWSA